MNYTQAMVTSHHQPLFTAHRKVPEHCTRTGCELPALHHVPTSSADLGDLERETLLTRGHCGQRVALCREHLQEYNRAQKEAMEQVRAWEAVYRSDAVWNRPSWPRSARIPPRYTNPDLAEQLLREASNLGARTSRPSQNPPNTDRQHSKQHSKPSRTSPHLTRLSARAIAALAVLGLEPEANLQEVRNRYHQLVKRLHPDANPAASAANAASNESELKAVNRAWQDLKPFLKATRSGA
ncbi:MAG: J domain-containing protein [Alphaproteobacteria bacterium]